MRVAVISDIHGNLHALEAVLEALAGDAPDAVWCLGDLVGYGPQPNRCCELVAERADVCLIGNHDLGVLGRISLEAFADDAAASARWTEAVLAGEARAYLESLAPQSAQEGVGLYHGSPRDPVWEYVLSAEAALGSLEAAAEPLVLVGHSHVALAFWLAAGTLKGDAMAGGTAVELEAGERWILNPGSVGQPRDGDPRAAYLLLDLDAARAEYRRVPYAVERTQAELRERGLPEALAVRLEQGV